MSFFFPNPPFAEFASPPFCVQFLPEFNLSRLRFSPVLLCSVSLPFFLLPVSHLLLLPLVTFWNPSFPCMKRWCILYRPYFFSHGRRFVNRSSYLSLRSLPFKRLVALSPPSFLMRSFFIGLGEVIAHPSFFFGSPFTKKLTSVNPLLAGSGFFGNLLRTASPGVLFSVPF